MFILGFSWGWRAGGASRIVIRVEPFCKHNFCQAVNALQGSACLLTLPDGHFRGFPLVLGPSGQRTVARPLAWMFGGVSVIGRGGLLCPPSKDEYLFFQA